MHSKLAVMSSLFACSVFILLTSGGCGFGGAGALPSSMEIDLPDGTSTKAEVGAGPPSLANTEWNITRSSTTGQGAKLLRLVFDEDGGISRFEDNTIAAEIFGTTLYLDGQLHSTLQQGLTYSAGVYGAETADGSGIGFEALVKGLYSGLNVASASAGATGTFDDDDMMTMRGTFWYKTSVNDLVLGFTGMTADQVNLDETFEFVAHRVPDDGEG